MFNVKDELLKSVLELQDENEKLKFKNENLTKELAELKEKFGKAGRKSKMNSEQKEEIKYLYETKTATMDELAKNYGCSKALIHKIVHEDEEKAQPQSQIIPERHAIQHIEESKPEPTSASRTTTEVWEFMKNEDMEVERLVLGDARFNFCIEGVEHLAEWIEDCIKCVTVLKRKLSSSEEHITAQEIEEVWNDFQSGEIIEVKETLEYLCEDLGILDDAVANTITFLKEAHTES